ncbi:MAG: DUF58 domain-containing protein [Pyrinomonadaceae bacterium]
MSFREKLPPELREFKAWRNAILGTLLVLCGLVSAIIAMLARRAADASLAGLASIASLAFVALILVLVVPPLARSARAEVADIDFPFAITGGGLIFLGVFAIVAFAAWNTGNNLLFLVFSVLASALFVAWVAARASLRDLIVSARFPDHIFAGEISPVIVTLRNTKRLLPSLSVLVEARSPVVKSKPNNWHERQKFVKRALAHFTYVPRRAAAEQHVLQLFPKRGHVLITGFELSTRFPFGFFRRRTRLRARNVDLIVYPKLEAIGDELHLLPMNAGRRTSARRGAGHDLLSLREYQPQDDLRHIDWKATARSSRLVVREFMVEDERRVTIALDTRAARDDDAKDFSERFEKGVTLAASLVAHFVDEHAEVRLALGDETGSYGKGREHLYDCLKRLALTEPMFTKATANDESLTIPESFQSSDAAASIIADRNYSILLTTAAPGSIPAGIWRTAHVIYL